ncbi:MAG: S53 family peptidase, partial [Streptosporangiaceae bacterium]
SPTSASATSASATSASAAAFPHSGAARIARMTAAARTGLRAACPQPRPGDMRCFALVQPQYAVNRALAAGRKTRPRGWTPQQLERAYRLPVDLLSHQTVAVAIAGRTPHLGSYLRTYRAHFGLPACGQPSGCLRIVNQKGKARPAAPSSLGSGWDIEATLDVSMISVACPHCKILVVEANSPAVSDLARAAGTAARLGAQVISNSYGIRESGYSQPFARYYEHRGHTVVVSSGDLGFDAANFPANLASVTAVGGTTLSRAHNARGFTERVWNNPSIFGAGSSGCSAYVRKPAWQRSPHCPGRTVADTSAVAADIPIYNKAWGGWLTVAGTSVAAPLTAGIYGLAGNGRLVSTRDLYRHAADFFDVTRGNNVLAGSPKGACGNDYLCTAKPGDDAPTGLGTPDGIGGF